MISLSTQERGNLYLLTPFKRLGYAGGILVSLAHSISSSSRSSAVIEFKMLCLHHIVY
jgi:hypothetical protein